jgi:hypothetical protein
MAYTTINKSTDYFNTKLWSGNGSSQALTGVGHQTDMVWIKSRTDTRKHNLYDVVRGVQKRIVPNDTVAEDTVPGVTAFGTDGFTVGSETDTNGGSRNFVGWSWKANGAGSSNTDGSITSTVSANTTAGFSIVKYTGYGGVSTVGHGLGVAPNLIINKNFESGSTNWFVGLIDWTKRLKLQGTNTWDANTVWNDTAPTNQVFSLNGTNANSSGQDYIAYCFAEKTGYSKFGSYSGNSNADGTFIYLGFKPSFIMVKRTDTSNSYDNWIMYDNKRSGYNVDNDRLHADISDAENTDNTIDIVSNGFKIRSANSNLNGGSHIYMAFGQSLVGSNNIPATAR